MKLSGVQLLVQAMAPLSADEKLTPLPKIEFEEAEEHHCAICGGVLTKDREETKKTMSGKWASNADLIAKDEDYVCSACQWILTLNNRINYMAGDSNVHIFDLNGRHTIESNQEFVDYLEQGINGPTILAMTSSYERMKKHTAWKLNQCVTYSSHLVKVAMFDYGIKGSVIEGTAQFEAKDMVAKIHEFEELFVSLMNDPDFVKKFGKKAIPAKKGICLSMLKRSLLKRGIATPELILAARVAANIIFTEEK